MSKQQDKRNVPDIRFPGFEGEWSTFRVNDIVNRVKKSVTVEKNKIYEEIGIRSHGKGIFYKPSRTGESLGNKSVFWIVPDVFIVNIVFAWECAVAKTTKNEVGKIVSHRFPMYHPIKDITDLDFILIFFKTKLGKYKLGLASPGGAGRNKTLGQKEFLNLQVIFPTFHEQQKIALFIYDIDTKIEKLSRKKELLKQYKKGVMQKLFSREIRFKDENGEEFPEWEEKKLGKVGVFSKGQGISKNDLVDKGYPCIRYAEIYTKYNFVVSDPVSNIPKKLANKSVVIEHGDILFAGSGETIDEIGKSVAYIGDQPVAISGDTIILSPGSKINSIFLSYYLNSNITRKYLRKMGQGQSVVHIYSKELKKLCINLPVVKEQKGIADFLMNYDSKMNQMDEEISAVKEFKKGLLQGMFV